MTGPVAIVSGSSGGLGAPIAARLGEDGFVVAGCDLAPDSGSGAALHVVLDVTDEAAVAAFTARVVHELGPPAVVVTAAGIQRTGASEAVESLDWRQQIEVNLTGTWNVIQAALPSMLAHDGGRVITISSEVGLAGLPGYAAYAASKGGVIALTKALAREYAPHGICVNSVAPGPIEAGTLLGGPAHNDEWLTEHVPLGRFGRPEEVAACIALLAGADGGYFAGQVLSPNGGTVI